MAEYIEREAFIAEQRHLYCCDGCDYFDIVWFKCKKHGNRHISEVECDKKL